MTYQPSPSIAVSRHGATAPTLVEVDLRRWDGTETQRRELAEEVREICHHVGFFELVGHGVPDEFRRRHFDFVERFFALPLEHRSAIDKARSPQFRGWERVGAELTDNRVDYREQLDLAVEYEPYPVGVEPAYLRIDGPNQWPDEAVIPGFRLATTRSS